MLLLVGRLFVRTLLNLGNATWVQPGPSVAVRHRTAPTRFPAPKDVALHRDLEQDSRCAGWMQ